MLKPAHLARIDLNLLVLFDAVLQERHVARAAERLSLTPSAVSHGLGRLRRVLNDPLFLRMPRGVVPTARALELAAPIADILARAGGVLASATPFDPSTARRRFAIGAPDAVAAVLALPLLDAVRCTAPGIDISLRELLPQHRTSPIEHSWSGALAGLETRDIDLAVMPIGRVSPRFASRFLFEEEFVVAMRAGHTLSRDPILTRYCGMRHLLVSQTGDAHGFVDELLAKRGMSRRVVLTVPSFMMALAMIGESDLIGTLPRQLVARYGARFGVVSAELPLQRQRDPICAVATKAALMDAGVAWLLDTLVGCTAPVSGKSKSKRKQAS